jgi:hypothetical protein
MELVFIVVIGLAALAVGAVILLKKKGGSVANTTDAAHAEAMSVVSRLTDALGTANKTVREQAIVVASPPVQAVINSAPQIVPGSTIPTEAVSAPVPAPSAAPAPVYGMSPAPAPHLPPPPARPPGNQADREIVCMGEAFGWGSPPYQRALERFGGAEGYRLAINQYKDGGRDTDNAYNNSHASPIDYGYHWDGQTWVTPINPVGGIWDANAQRFV